MLKPRLHLSNFVSHNVCSRRVGGWEWGGSWEGMLLTCACCTIMKPLLRGNLSGAVEGGGARVLVDAVEGGGSRVLVDAVEGGGSRVLI